MSRSNEESSKLGTGDATFKMTAETEKLDPEEEIEGGKGAEFNVSGAKRVKSDSEIVEEFAEIGADTEGDEGAGVALRLHFYVINHIAKLLDFQDLKSLRQVNKLWSEGATPTFLQKSAFSLTLGKTKEEELNAFGRETKNLKGVKALKLDRSSDSERFRDIVSALAPTLKELVLEDWKDNSMLIAGVPIQFPALSKVTLKDCYSWNLYGRRLLENLHPVAPHVAHLVIANVTINFLYNLTTFENETRVLPRTPEVKCLSMRVADLEMVFLYKFPATWENLDITLSVSVNNHIGRLYRLLRKNSEALINLKLKIDDRRTFRPQDRQLRFPGMFSKLEKLELNFVSLTCGLDFEGAELNFSEIMPKLTSLSVKLPDNFESAARIWIGFFPHQVFGGLKHLKVEGMSFARFLPEVEIPQDWAEKMFPNASLQIN